MFRKSILLTMLAVASITPPAGQAASKAAPRLVSPVTVRFDVVELGGDDGIARLYLRLRQAARGSCDSLPALDRWTAIDRRRCAGDTLEAAIRQVHDARLTAHHRACQRDAASRRCEGPRKAWAGAPPSQHRDSPPPRHSANL
jgi:UrcA family protein